MAPKNIAHIFAIIRIKTIDDIATKKEVISRDIFIAKSYEKTFRKFFCKVKKIIANRSNIREIFESSGQFFVVFFLSQLYVIEDIPRIFQIARSKAVTATRTIFQKMTISAIFAVSAKKAVV